MNPTNSQHDLTKLILTSYDINLIVNLNGQITKLYAQKDHNLESEEVTQYTGASLFDCTNLDLVKSLITNIHKADQDNKPKEGFVDLHSPSGLKKIFFAIMPLGNESAFVYLKHHTPQIMEQRYRMFTELFRSLGTIGTIEQVIELLVSHISKYDPTIMFGIYLFDEANNLTNNKFSGKISTSDTETLMKLMTTTSHWGDLKTGIKVLLEWQDYQEYQFSESFDYLNIALFPILYLGEFLGCFTLLSAYEISSETTEFMEEFAYESGIIIDGIGEYQKSVERVQLLYTILEGMDDYLFVFTAEGILLHSSTHFHQFLQNSSHQATSLNLFDYLDVSQKDEFSNLLKQTDQGLRPTYELKLSNNKGKKIQLVIQIQTLQKSDQTTFLARKGTLGDLPPKQEGQFSHQIFEISEKLPLPIMVVQQQSFNILYANTNLQNILKFSSEMIVQKNFLDLISPLETTHLITAIKSEGLSKLESEYAWEFQSNDGQIIHSRLIVNSILYSDEKAYVIIFRDLPVEPRTFLIHEPAESYQTNPKEQFFCKLSADGILIQANQAYCDLVGKPVERIIGRPLQESLFLEDYEEVFQHFSKLTFQSPLRKHHNRMLNKLGKIRWVEWTDQGIFDGDQLIEIHSFGRDITEDYQQELLRSSTEQRYQALVENLPMVIYVFYVKTLFPVYISPQITKITGYTATDFYNKPEFMLELFHPDERDEIDEKFRLKITENQSAPFEFRIIHKDGRVRWIEESGSNITLPDGSRLYQGIFRDVTGRYLVREKLQYYSKFERLINEIAIHLMDSTPQTAHSELQYTIDELGKFMQVDRSYIFDIDFKENSMSNIYEWCRDGIPPMIDQLQNLPFSLFPWWMEQMKNNNEIVLNNLDDAPKEADHEKYILLDQGIKSLLVVPLFYQGKPQGFIGFDMVSSYTCWEQESIKLLRLVSSMIISTFKRLSRD